MLLDSRARCQAIALGERALWHCHGARLRPSPPIWESLPSWNRYAHTIKAALRRDVITATDKRIRLIGGLDVYEQAGGEVKRDLFDERAQGLRTRSCPRRTPRI